MATSFAIMNSQKFSIDTSASPHTTPTWSPIAAGIIDAETTFNEETTDDSYLDGDGFATTDVTRIQPVTAFSGHRLYGDAAQDFIFSKVLLVGTGRRAKYKWEQPDGSSLMGDATIAAIEGPGGASGEKGAISFEVRFNGLPTITPPTP